MHPLEALRVRRDWSYGQLARAIFKITGIRRSVAGWRKVCVGEVTTPQRTTQDAIDRFLAAKTQKAS